MMPLWQMAANSLAALAVLALLARHYRSARREQAEAAGRIFDRLLPLLDGATITTDPASGTERLTGRIHGRRVDIRTITDTLALRKLPSLWLMITLPGDTGQPGDLDLMMRPAGFASFSNFDRLPDTLRPLAGFPEDALIKTSDPSQAPSPEHLRPLLKAFVAARGKEILVTPKGVRMVIQLSEAERARYGVFRQASFQTAPIAPDLVLPLIASLEDLLRSLSAGVAGQSANQHQSNHARSFAHG